MTPKRIPGNSGLTRRVAKSFALACTNAEQLSWVGRQDRVGWQRLVNRSFTGRRAAETFAQQRILVGRSNAGLRGSISCCRSTLGNGPPIRLAVLWKQTLHCSRRNANPKLRKRLPTKIMRWPAGRVPAIRHGGELPPAQNVLGTGMLPFAMCENSRLSSINSSQIIISARSFHRLVARSTTALCFVPDKVPDHVAHDLVVFLDIPVLQRPGRRCRACLRNHRWSRHATNQTKRRCKLADRKSI